MRDTLSLIANDIQWVRAEILGAFFNAVFLIALCVSIILEALTRFVEPPEINSPKLILVVGCAGLFSNLLGFVVLGGHGHSHGPGEHGHEHGHSHGHDEEQGMVHDAADEDGAVADVIPEVVVSRASVGGGSNKTPDRTRRIRWDDADEENQEGPNSKSVGSPQSRGRESRRSSKGGHSRFASIDDMSIYPSSFRQDIIAAGLNPSNNPPPASDTSEEYTSLESEAEVNEQSPLLKNNAKGANGSAPVRPRAEQPKSRRRRDSSVHNGHNHTLPKKPGKKGGHSHGDMGMNAMVLHVIGDALGNVGVIITALIIWLTDWPGKLYADPAVSLVITAIILKTSIPLTRATSRILLQATPENISISDIRQDIEALPGVVSCHHMHVWQLSDTKIVASLHLQVSFPINTHSGAKYMQLAKRARKCLHAYGIHSATIQPEFCLDEGQLQDADSSALTLDGAADNACLLDCIEDCAAEGCCDNASKTSSIRRASDSSQTETGHQH